MRRELPEDVYVETPWCWMSRERWVAHGLVLYDALYDELRATLRAPCVGRNTWIAWLITESKCADVATGRDCRPSVATVQRRIGRCERTVQRCRELGGLLDIRSVVFRGRKRTKAERFESYKREDRFRGWAAVAVLHDSPSYGWAVDNSTVETLLKQGIVTPLPCKGGKPVISPTEVVVLRLKPKKRRAPLNPDKKRKPSNRSPIDSKARLVASRCRSDARFPAWCARLTVRGLAGVLRTRIERGWDVDDFAGAVRDYEIAGNVVLSKPCNPYGYLGHILAHTPVDEPPALLDRARTAQLDLEEHARFRTQLAEQRAKTVAAADSPARAAARAGAAAAGRRALGRAAGERAAAEQVRREIALKHLDR